MNHPATGEAFGSKLNSFGQIQRFIAESYAEYQAHPCWKWLQKKR